MKAGQCITSAASALVVASLTLLGASSVHAQTAGAAKTTDKAVPARVLIVLSAADKWTRADGSKYDSGVWAEEFIVLDEKFRQAGLQVDIATPGGVAPTIDKRSLEPKFSSEEHVKHFQSYLSANKARMAHPIALKSVDVARYAAIAIPGGHGPVEDLYKDADMGRVLTAADRAAKIIAPVCHGQAALLAAKSADGRWVFAGRKMTSFSDDEEREFGTADNAPWLLAATLRQNGARYEQGPNWGAFIVKDGNLISGQNPASTAPLADAVIAALGR